MFIKILTKTYKGEKRYYASLVENKRKNRYLISKLPMLQKSLVLFMTTIDAEVL